MGNKYELTCRYCGNTWGINYLPKEAVYCSVCNDTHIRAVDVSAGIDYYEGSPPFRAEDPDWNM